MPETFDRARQILEMRLAEIEAESARLHETLERLGPPERPQAPPGRRSDALSSRHPKRSG